jgi:hypothetical protein
VETTAYAIARTVDATFGDAIEPVTAALAAEGFGRAASCNVVVRCEGVRTIVSAIEPRAAMRLAGNPDLEPLAEEVRERIARALASL